MASTVSKDVICANGVGRSVFSISLAGEERVGLEECLGQSCHLEERPLCWPDCEQVVGYLGKSPCQDQALLPSIAGRAKGRK